MSPGRPPKVQVAEPQAEFLVDLVWAGAEGFAENHCFFRYGEGEDLGNGEDVKA